MAFYSVSCLLKGVHISRPHLESLWEENIFLVEAGNENEAKKKGEEYARKDEAEYEVEDGKPGEPRGKLRWTFMQVESVYDIDTKEIRSGTELFSRFLRDSEVSSLLTPFPDERPAG